MTCPACQAAEANPWTGQYRSGCLECAARQLSGSPEHHESRRTRQLTAAYKDALARIFGQDWRAGHERVKAWAARRSASPADTSMAP